MFVGRSAELRLLEAAYGSRRSELVVIYGRRRIGKSSLVEQFLKGKPDVFTVEALEDERTSTQLAHFTRRMAQYLAGRLPEETRFPDWDRALNYFTTNALGAPSKAKRIVFLDELQWMAAGRSALVSLLKYYWDNHWKRCNVMLILCGSISSFMLRNVVRSRALYGRTTLELNLKGLLPNEAFALLGNKRSPEEVLRYLLVFGAVPKYLEDIDTRKSFAENLNRMCFSSTGIMTGEVNKVFHSQFRTPGTYLHLVKILLERARTVKELSEHSGIASGGGFAEYLQNLVAAELVVPLTPFDKQKASRTVKYAVGDEFLAFYLKYMEPNVRLIGMSRSSRIFETVTERSFDVWLGLAFERFCRKHAGYLAEKMGFSDSMLQAAPFFRREDEGFQIDLLYRRSDKVIVVCEIKHTSSPVPSAVIPEVERKCRLLRVPRGHTVHKALISLYGPDAPLKDCGYFDHVVTLEDILG